jgi:hypothetical protein
LALGGQGFVTNTFILSLLEVLLAIVHNLLGRIVCILVRRFLLFLVLLHLLLKGLLSLFLPLLLRIPIYSSLLVGFACSIRISLLLLLLRLGILVLGPSTLGTTFLGLSLFFLSGEARRDRPLGCSIFLGGIVDALRLTGVIASSINFGPFVNLNGIAVYSIPSGLTDVSGQRFKLVSRLAWNGLQTLGSQGNCATELAGYVGSISC